jgi:hypothetical protein
VPAVTYFNTYKQSFPHANLTRSPEGMAGVVIHTDDGTLVFQRTPTRSIPRAGWIASWRADFT